MHTKAESELPEFNMMQFNVVSQRPNGEAHIPTLSLNRHHRLNHSYHVPRNLATTSTSFAYRSLPYSPRPFSLVPHSTSQTALTMSSSPSTPSPTRSAFSKPYGGMRFKHRPFRLDSTAPKRARSKIRKPNKYIRLEKASPILPENPSFRGPESLYFHSNSEREAHIHDGVAKPNSFDRSPTYRPMTAPSRAGRSGNNGKEGANVDIYTHQSPEGSQLYPQRGSSLDKVRDPAAQAPPGEMQMPGKPVTLRHNEFPQLCRIKSPSTNADLTKRSKSGRSRSLEQELSQAGDRGKKIRRLAMASASNNAKSSPSLKYSKGYLKTKTFSSEQDAIHTPNMHIATPTCADGTTFSHREALDLYDRYKSTGTFSLLHDVIASINNYDDWHAYQTLMKAYIHGAARNDTEFADRMIDTLSDLLKPDLPADQDTILYLFTASNIPEKLEQFVVDRCMAAGKKFLEGQDLCSLPRAFICRALETTVNRLEKPEETRLQDACRYHLHHRHEQCYRLKETQVIGIKRTAGNICARAAANTDHRAGHSYQEKDTQKVETESGTKNGCADIASDAEFHVIAVAKAITIHAAVRPKLVVTRSSKPKAEAPQSLPNKSDKMVAGLSPAKPKAETQQSMPNKQDKAFMGSSPARKPVLIHNSDLGLYKHESSTVVRRFNDGFIRSLPPIQELERSDLAKDEDLRAALGRRSLEASGYY